MSELVPPAVQVLVGPAGEVAAVHVDGVSLSAFEVVTQHVQVTATCKYCAEPITANDTYWSANGEEAATWYGTDDMCCGPSYQRPHMPARIKHTPDAPETRTVRSEPDPRP